MISKGTNECLLHLFSTGTVCNPPLHVHVGQAPDQLGQWVTGRHSAHPENTHTPKAWVKKGCAGGTDTHDVSTLPGEYGASGGYRGVPAVAAAVSAALPDWAGLWTDARGAATIGRSSAGRRVDAGSLLYLCSDGLQAESRRGRQVPQVLDRRRCFR